MLKNSQVILIYLRERKKNYSPLRKPQIDGISQRQFLVHHNSLTQQNL